ncbi:Serine protease 30 [Trichinella murrelli]|uniref:Serine protease 30 n=1 Tax=Trichinella murrelli TaxID=144512 RepID=A0A0V0U8V7_9BILA|nr:Serine protease 30 [Trichinella murrelli]
MKRFHHLEIFFYRALLIFCIIIKKTISGDCGKPYFEPYLTNPRNPNRIVGGWVAKPYSFPWTVHILTHVSGLLYESCGGSLISLDSTNASDTILTASHCVRVNNRLVNANAITVAAGVFNIKKLNEPHRVTSKVLAYISDNFDDVSMENDIAVLRLKVEIQHSEYISPVCLPKQNQKLPWGEMCFVSGWGLTRESGKPSSKLRQVGIPILRNSNCPFIDADDMFCAGDMTGGKDSCQGDSGGPLVCKLNDTFVQMGIVSFGDGCARKDHPGIYTKVPHYVKWIYNQAAKLPDSSTSSEIGEEKPDYSNDFHHSWGSVGNYFHFPFFDSSDDIWNNENFGNENSPFSQLPWSFLSEPMPLFRSRSSFINRDVEEEAGDWSPYSTNQHFQTYYGLPHIGEEGQPHYPLENWPDMNGKYPLHHHSEFHPPYLYSNRPSMNEGHLSTPPNFESPENQPPYTSKNSPEMNGNQYSGKSYTKFYQPYLYPNGPSTNDHRPSLASNFEKPENQPQYTSKNRLEMSGNHHFGKSYRKFRSPYSYANGPSINGDHPSSPPNFQNHENRPTYTSERRHEMNGNYYSGNRPPYSHSNKPTMNENRSPLPPYFRNLDKETFSQYCGNPHFEPYLANPHYPNQVVGEWVARPYSFPWTVHVLAHISGFWYESCGGSLISFDYSNASDTVLTSSHCVRVNNRLVDANAITVTAGAFDIRDLNEPHRVTSKVLAYMSDNFGDVGKPNDVAMLRLKVKIPHSEYISPVCLPYTYQDMPWGETCFLSGWDLSKESGKPSSKLYQVGIPILQKNNCRFVDAYDIFCVGDAIGGIDPSQVDSGGPLVCKLNDSYVQIGIVSFRYGHAGKDHVGIYSKVPYYLNWIYNQLWWLPDSFNSSYAGVEGNRPPYSHSHRPTMNENRPPPPPDSQNFAYALNMKRWHPFGIPFHNAFLLFCIIIKETFSQYCGNPYFEPYFTNPHYPNQIVGEWVARPYSFPWTVHVLAHISGFWYESCVGSLISFDYTNASDTVLTSSHCVRVNNRLVDANAITVTAGAFNIRELNEPHRVTSKVLAYMSDNFGDVSKPNDVALLRLKVKIPHSHYISSVCLPYHSYQEMPWGETCFLSGWGFTRGRPLSELRQVGIPILRKSNCRFTDAYDIFCAGDMGGGNYSFQIDSGGPLVCKLNDSYVQIGIVSFGYNHAGKHYPGIFSNVPFYVNWIYNQLSWLPDSFNSSDIGGEESDCPDDCYHPWRSVFNHFKHRKASFHMDSLESTEGDGSDWSPYSTNQHYQSNYDGSQSGEGNRPPYSHSHRPTMNENRPPPPPDSQNFGSFY